MASLASLKEIIRCLKEEWLLIRFWDRRTAMMFCCTEHSIALRWSHTFSGKLETEFFANKFSIKLIIKKKLTFQSTASNDLGALRTDGKSKISCVITCKFGVTLETIRSYPRQTLNNRRCSETRKGLRSGNIGSKSAEFVVGSQSIVSFTHPLTRIA